MHFVHGPGDAGVGGAGCVGPVPEEDALVGGHGGGRGGALVEGGNRVLRDEVAEIEKGL